MQGEAVPLLAGLLSIRTGDRYPALDLTPQRLKEKTLRALVAQVEGLDAIPNPRIRRPEALFAPRVNSRGWNVNEPASIIGLAEAREKWRRHRWAAGPSTGEGGPGYEFADEFAPGLHHDSAGILSMANDGPDTNGSQFFITHREVNRLNYLHTVFGRTVRGLEVLPQVRQDDPMKVKILRLGAAARAFRADDATFAALTLMARGTSAQFLEGKGAHAHVGRLPFVEAFLN